MLEKKSREVSAEPPSVSKPAIPYDVEVDGSLSDNELDDDDADDDSIIYDVNVSTLVIFNCWFYSIYSPAVAALSLLGRSHCVFVAWDLPLADIHGKWLHLFFFF